MAVIPFHYSLFTESIGKITASYSSMLHSLSGWWGRAFFFRNINCYIIFLAFLKVLHLHFQLYIHVYVYKAFNKISCHFMNVCWQGMFNVCFVCLFFKKLKKVCNRQHKHVMHRTDNAFMWLEPKMYSIKKEQVFAQMTDLFIM